MNPVALEQIKTIAQKLKSKNSSGFDNVQMLMVKKVIDNIKSPLAHIFNKLFVKGIVPKQIMKLAKIVPIFKA